MAKTRGTGLLMLWTDVDPEHEAAFNRWYGEEHLDRLLAIPGFLSAARALTDSTAPGAGQRIFNNRVDAGLTLFFMAVVVIVIVASAREWWLVLSRRKAPRVNETPFVATALAAGD